MNLLFGNRSKKPDERQEEKTVLFVCVENAGRSQIAEGFFRKYTPSGYLTVSAGTKPSGEINPIVIQVLKELGVDISKQKSKIITEDMIKNSSIRVCCPLSNDVQVIKDMIMKIIMHLVW